MYQHQEMFSNVEIKEEDPLSVTENESQFFILKTNNDVDNDCDMAVKSQIPYTACSSLENGECFIKHQIKSENVSCCNTCEVESKIDIDSKKNRESLPGDPKINFKKHNRDHEIDNKIEIKEESWWLDREISSGCSDIKDFDFVAVKSQRLSTEAVSADNTEDSSLVCVTVSKFSYSRNGPDCESQESNVTKTPSVEKLVNSELSTECKDKDDSCSRDLSLHMAKSPHKCKITNYSKMRRHNFTDKGKTYHKCEICEKKFSKLSGLKLHYLIHDCKKPYKCDICDKMFTQSSNLNKHNLIHKGTKAHKCETCEKKFTQLSDLKRHNLIHEGKRPHKCKICEKRFTLSSVLKRHNLIHEGKKPHKCEVCEKRFTLLSNLKRHTLIHEGKKAYKCEICEMRFSRLSNLKRHSLIHKGKKAS